MLVVFSQPVQSYEIIIMSVVVSRAYRFEVTIFSRTTMLSNGSLKLVKGWDRILLGKDSSDLLNATIN